MKALLFFITFIVFVISQSSLIAKDGRIDPGLITWWKTKWAPAPIELSQNNAGTVDATITFRFRPSTTVKQAYVEVLFPASFTTVVNKKTDTLDLEADTDETLAFTVTLPSTAGVFGPFGIITRSSSTGQIIDANFVFACVATTSSVSKSSAGLSVTTSTATTPVVGQTENTLIFSFSLTQNL